MRRTDPKTAARYVKGAIVHVSADATGDFCVVHSTGSGFRFRPGRLRAFIASNGFGTRLAKALETLGVGDALTIKTARQRLVVCRPTGTTATIRRRFRLERDIV
jgi:hypothetical protein